MNIDQVLSLLKATKKNSLTPVQELILRSTWEGKTYNNIAKEAHYKPEYVKEVAAELWQLPKNERKPLALDMRM